MDNKSDNGTENAATPVKLTKAEGQKLAQIKLRTGPGVPHDIRLKGKIANKKSIVHRLKKENEKEEEKESKPSISPWVVGLLIFIVIAGPVFQLIGSFFENKKIE